MFDSLDWWKHGKNIAYFDIEVTDLKAEWGFVLSWCLKYRDDPNVRYSIVTKEEIWNYDFDKRVIKELLEELNNVDILVTYYGTRFDIPYVRSRSLYHGFDFPKYGSIYHWDLYYKVRYGMALSRNSLDNSTTFLGIEGKTPIDKQYWLKSKYGDPEALNYVLEHNIADVEILEDLHKKLEPYSKWTRKSI